MSNPNQSLYEIVMEKLQADPNVDQAQLEAYVQSRVAADPQLAMAVGQKMLQINLGDTTAFQNLIQGGIAYIGPQIQLQDSQLQALLEQLLQRLRPIGIPHNLPRSGAIQFVGRETDLQRLNDQLQQNDRLAITAVRGMGGIGKTELALQYAHFHLQQNTYPGGICWLRAREITIQIVDFAKATLGLNLPDGLKTAAEQVSYCWRNWTAGDVLVVVDDVTDYEVIKSYLPPQEPRFRVLLTTRLQLGASIRAFEILVLTEAASLQLLASLIGTERIAVERATATALCEWLGYLPLGLELVGRYLVQKPDLSLVEMQQRLESQRLAARALCRRSTDMTAEHESVVAAFQLSWQELSETARQLSYMLSLFALAPIPWSLVEQCFENHNPEDLEEIRDSELLNPHLLQRSGAATYRLHPLIREFFAAQLQSKAEQGAEWVDELKRRFCQSLISTALEIPYSLTREQLLVLTSIMPHLTEAATVLENWVGDEDAPALYVSLGRFHERQADYSLAESRQAGYRLAESWYLKCLQFSRIRFGEEHIYVAQSINNLAIIYDFQERYSDAEPLYVQALEMKQRLLGEEHEIVAQSLNNLAIFYRKQGRFSEAGPLYKQALESRRYTLGEEHPDVAQSLNNLASFYHSQGRFSEAEPLYLQALNLYQKALNEENLDVADVLNNLALLYRDQGRYVEAEPFYQRTLVLRQQILGQEHPDVADSLSSLALFYTKQGRYTEAEPLYQQSLQILEQKLGFSHPDTRQVRHNLAGFYNTVAKRFKVLGHYDKVNEYLEKAIELRTLVP